jgi:hypothetical protein
VVENWLHLLASGGCWPVGFLLINMRVCCCMQDPRIERIACTHSGTYADDCLCERVRQHKCYIVATCDKDLRRRIRKVRQQCCMDPRIVLLIWRCCCMTCVLCASDVECIRVCSRTTA